MIDYTLNTTLYSIFIIFNEGVIKWLSQGIVNVSNTSSSSRYIPSSRKRQQDVQAVE